MQLRGIGYVPAERRTVSPVPQWVKDIVPKPQGKNETIKSGSEDVERDTMPLIMKKVYRTLHHTKKLAEKLKGGSVLETARADWDFIFKHIKYTKDAVGYEQVRSPRRLIHDGKGDCDCFTVALSSLLINQKIPHYLRIMKQNGGSNWSHIYIVIPKSGKVSKRGIENNYIVMDCVAHKFDYEVPFTEKKDFPMALQYLDGINYGDGTGMLGSINKCTPQPIVERLRRFAFNDQIVSAGLIPTQSFFNDNGIPYATHFDDNAEQNFLVIETPVGTKMIPTIITQEQAKQILQAFHVSAGALPTATPTVQAQINSGGPGVTPGNLFPVPTSQAMSVVTPDAVPPQQEVITAQASIIPKGKNWWWYVLIAGGLLLAANSQEGNNLPDTPKPGLSGIKKKGKLKEMII